MASWRRHSSSHSSRPHRNPSLFHFPSSSTMLNSLDTSHQSPDPNPDSGPNRSPANPHIRVKLDKKAALHQAAYQAEVGIEQSSGRIRRYRRRRLRILTPIDEVYGNAFGRDPDLLAYHWLKKLVPQRRINADITNVDLHTAVEVHHRKHRHAAAWFQN